MYTCFPLSAGAFSISWVFDPKFSCKGKKENKPFQVLCFLYTTSCYILQDIFNTVLEVGVEMLQKQKLFQNPYNDWHCRLELYKTLFVFISTRNFPYHPPTEIILYILEESCKHDPCFEISTNLRIMIESFERTVHPQKEGLVFERVPQIIAGSSLVADSYQIERNETIVDHIELRPKDEITADVEMSVPTMVASVEVPNPITIEENKLFKRLKKTEKSPISKKDYTEEVLTRPTQLPIDVKDHNQLAINTPNINKDVKLKGCTADSKESSYHVASITTESKKTDDDEYIAELEAAFVYELK